MVESSSQTRGARASFGVLLKRYRVAAALSQEALAERAGISARAISAYERGLRQAPYRDTVRLLSTALGLAADDAAALAAAIPRGRGRAMDAGLTAPESGAAAAIPANTPAPRSNLLAPLSSFIGRTWERAEARRLLDGARLLTLTGPGGVGKTRLALAVAMDLVEHQRDGVWLVELAALSDPALAPQAVVRALHLREQPGQPLLDTLVSYLKDKHLLVVLDNCEHLVSACASLAEAVLRACPRVRILATSRESLTLAGEVVWRVPSLSYPEPAAEQSRPGLGRQVTAAQLAEYEAVQLFVARARERHADFGLSQENARAVSHLCRRLDGIPLAIELAAARLGVMPVRQLAARLDDAFGVLSGGNRSAPRRQQTLRATLDWSYELLEDAEKRLLRRLAVFATGWSLDAMEGICADEHLDAGALLDLLAALLDKSLVVMEEESGEARYRLLETVRQYCAERLEAAGETEPLRDRHLFWYLALTEQAAPALIGPRQAEWLDRLDRERHNLRAALSWSTAAVSRRPAGAALAANLWRFWEIRGRFSEGRRWLETLLDGADLPAEVRARALHGAGNLAYDQGAYKQAAAMYQESLDLCRALDHKPGMAAALNGLGLAAWIAGDFDKAGTYLSDSLALRGALGDVSGVARQLGNLGALSHARGDFPGARVLLAESLSLYREHGDRYGVASSLACLGAVAHSAAAYEDAATLFGECLALCRELGNPQGMADALGGLGCAALALGDGGEATVRFEESIALARELGHLQGLADALNGLGWALCGQGDLERAEVALRESLGLYRETEIHRGIVECIAGLATTAATRGQVERAVSLLAAALALRERYRLVLPFPDPRAFDRVVASVRATIGDAAYERALAAGHGVPLDQAIAMALSVHPRTGVAAPMASVV